MSIIDFHCHSHYSDGQLSPEALIALALKNGLTQLALTDHDTTAGVEEIQQAAMGTPIKIITGIEISARWKLHDIHIVGLNIDIHHLVMLKLIEQQKLSRHLRAKAISERIALLGVDSAYEKTCKIAGHEHLSRPHFATLLVNEGLAKDNKAAFKRYLVRGRPCYVPTPWVCVEDAVRIIHEAGGQAVLAHPLKYGFTHTKLNALIDVFKSASGDAIEVISGDMSLLQINTVAGLTQHFDLLSSTGSDFHDEQRSLVSLGRQKQLPSTVKPIWQIWG